MNNRVQKRFAMRVNGSCEHLDIAHYSRGETVAGSMVVFLFLHGKVQINLQFFRWLHGEIPE